MLNHGCKASEFSTCFSQSLLAESLFHGPQCYTPVAETNQTLSISLLELFVGNPTMVIWTSFGFRNLSLKLLARHCLTLVRSVSENDAPSWGPENLAAQAL